MALTPVAEGSPSGGALTAEEFAARVHIRRVHTVTDLCAAGKVPGATKIGHEWRVHWPTFYAAVAGPGVPDGEVVTSRQLAHYLRVNEQVVRRAVAAPGTPGKLPGFQLGKTWLHAMPAVNAQVGWSQNGGGAGPPAAGPAPAKPALSQTALEYPAPVSGQAPPARTGRSAAATARHRRLRSGPGSGPSPR
jgi:hypothetical protein